MRRGLKCPPMPNRVDKAVTRRKKMGGFKLLLTDWLISKDIHSEITNKKSIMMQKQFLNKLGQ